MCRFEFFCQNKLIDIGVVFFMHLKLNDKRMRKNILWLILFFFVITLFLTLETLNTKNILDAYLKIFIQPNFVFLSCLAITLIFMILFCVTNNLFISGLGLSLFLCAFYLINFYRREITGWVFVPSDFSFFKSFKAISSFARIKLHYRIVAVPIIIIFLNSILYLLFKKLIKSKIKLQSRLKIFLSACPCFCFYFALLFRK